MEEVVGGWGVVGERVGWVAFREGADDDDESLIPFIVVVVVVEFSVS